MASPYCNWVGRLLQLNGWSETIATCYARTMLNLNLLQVSTGVVLSEEDSTRVELLPMVALSEGLREFCGGLATMFPNIAPVAEYFSVIGWEKNDCRHNLTDFSLQGIIQGNQYQRLHALVRLHGRGLLTIQQFLLFTAHSYGILIFPILTGVFDPILR